MQWVCKFVQAARQAGFLRRSHKMISLTYKRREQQAHREEPLPLGHGGSAGLRALWARRGAEEAMQIERRVQQMIYRSNDTAGMLNSPRTQREADLAQSCWNPVHPCIQIVPDWVATIDRCQCLPGKRLNT